MEQKREEPIPDSIPFWQTVMDDTSLLILIGLVVPTILYTIWGIMELANLQIFSR